MRRLPSGDSAVIFPAGTDRRYVKDVSWAEALGADVTLFDPKVVIQNVPADTVAQDLGTRLSASVRILHSRPMLRNDGPPSRTGSLCLTVATEADAAMLLREGVIIDYCLYRCVAYRPDDRPQICHRCQTWDHKARGCRKPPRCAHCGGAYESSSCNKLAEERCCPNCRGSHLAYSRTCPFYQTSLADLQAQREKNKGPALTTIVSHEGGNVSRLVWRMTSSRAGGLVVVLLWRDFVCLGAACVAGAVCVATHEAYVGRVVVVAAGEAAGRGWEAIAALSAWEATV